MFAAVNTSVIAAPRMIPRHVSSRRLSFEDAVGEAKIKNLSTRTVSRFHHALRLTRSLYGLELDASDDLDGWLHRWRSESRPLGTTKNAASARYAAKLAVGETNASNIAHV